MDPNEIQNQLDLYPSKKENFIDFNEFVDFLKNNQLMNKKIAKNCMNRPLSPRKQQNLIWTSSNNICLLKKKEIELLHRKFEDLDPHNDLFLSIKDYITKLRLEKKYIKIILYL